MRLQVEIAATSCTSGASTSSRSTPAARPSVSATRSRSSSGAVLCDTPSASNSAMTHPIVLSGPPALCHVGQLAQLAVDPSELRGHDRDVDQDQGDEHDVRRRDVLSGLVEGKCGHQDTDVALDGTPGAILDPVCGAYSSPSRARRSRERLADADFAASSNRTSVTHSNAIPARQTRK